VTSRRRNSSQGQDTIVQFKSEANQAWRVWKQMWWSTQSHHHIIMSHHASKVTSLRYVVNVYIIIFDPISIKMKKLIWLNLFSFAKWWSLAFQSCLLSVHNDSQLFWIHVNLIYGSLHKSLFHVLTPMGVGRRSPWSPDLHKHVLAQILVHMFFYLILS
jgi:hypothetical protein